MIAAVIGVRLGLACISILVQSTVASAISESLPKRTTITAKTHIFTNIIPRLF